MDELNTFTSSDTWELFIIVAVVTFLVSLPFIGGCLKPIGVSPKTLHFDEGEDLKFFEVYQKPLYDRKIAFTVSSSTPWIEVTPTEGILGKDDRVKVQVYLNRNYPQSKKDEYPPFATAEIIVASYFQKEKVIATTAPNYYTEIFEGDVDLAQKSLIFTPNGGISFYGLEVKEISNFPNDVSDEDKISFSQDNLYELTLEENQTISFYGKSYNKLYISGEGWIGFGEPKKAPSSETSIPCGANSKLFQKAKWKDSNEWEETITYHFSTPNITAFPIDTSKGGKAYLKRLQNKIVITYIDAPTAGTSNEVRNNIQVEIYLTGKITLNYLSVDSKAVGIVGLSYGTGKLIVPGGFVESDLVQ